MIKALKRTGLLVILSCLSMGVFAQGTIKGIIQNSSEESLPGTSIVIQGTTVGTIASIDGSFNLKAPVGDHVLEISFMGFKPKTINVTVANNETKDLGIIVLEEDDVMLEGVEVMASFVRDRYTPVAVSTVAPYIIDEKLGNQEYPEILKSTPSVYATKQGGGYGDSRIYLRGFDSNNIGVLINGIPVNDMESGKVYWSNWAGLSDVTQNMQVQRGLGASKLALSSVGGTINIITKSTEAEKGGSFYSGVGNNGMVKQSFTISTGLLENGWAVTLSGAHEYGDGYIQATSYEGWSYYANISKIINDEHRLSFTAFGAPQWHNQRYYRATVEEYKSREEGITWNPDWGYRNGEVYNKSYNYYHKPQISLNHYWNVNERTLLSTSAYVSLSNGGGRRLIGVEVLDPANDQIYWDYMTRQNVLSPNGSTSIIANSINSHDWYGVLSTLTTDLYGLKLTGGFDGRYYKGYHTQEIDDLLGGEYFLDNSNINRDPATPLKKGDNISYYNTGEVLWAGLFGQAEYITDEYSGFVSASAAQNKYRRDDFFQYLPENQLTDWLNFWTYTVKGGVNYNINDNMKVFANGGYITRAPYFRNSFIGFTNEFNEDAKNEKIITAEVGYGYQNSVFNVLVDLYRTNWKDKGLVRSIGDDVANIPGINALHQGIEIEAEYKPTKKLTTKAMVSIGDWVWDGSVNFDLYDRNQVYQGTYNTYTDGVHVGNSAQTTGYGSITYEVLPKMKVGVDYTYYGNHYAEFDPTTRTNEEDAGIESWQLPSVSLFDLNFNYKFKIGKVDAKIYGNVYNLFDTEYISDADDGATHDYRSGLVYYGFGRTWSTGLKIEF